MGWETLAWKRLSRSHFLVFYWLKRVLECDCDGAAQNLTFQKNWIGVLDLKWLGLNLEALGIRLNSSCSVLLRPGPACLISSLVCAATS